MNIIRLVMATVLLLTAGARAQQTINIQGPETLILLGQKLNQLYKMQQPQVSLGIHGGNIHASMPLLLKGEFDIVQSRGMLPAESSRPDVLSVPIGVEGVVIYVNEANPLNELSVAQVRSIYTGETVNWKQLGGPDQRILLYGGESTSGVEQYFIEAVLRGGESFGYEGKASTKDLLEAIATHPSGIGFASFGFAPRVKALRIRANSGTTAIEPTIANIRSLQYPISRYIYWYLARPPQGALRNFCTWVFSSGGQLVVEGVGFLPLAPEERAAGLRKLGLSGNMAQPASLRR
jgi:phosphate transport system substrate-binding protein